MCRRNRGRLSWNFMTRILYDILCYRVEFKIEIKKQNIKSTKNYLLKMNIIEIF